jgi:hypothetical protein
LGKLGSRLGETLGFREGGFLISLGRTFVTHREIRFC